MNQPEQDAMQIIKTLLRPLIPTLVELIKEYEQTTTQETADNPLTPTIMPEDVDPPHASVDVMDYAPKPTRSAKPFSEEQNAYAHYQQLPESLKSSMSGFIDGTTLESFLQPLRPIEQFWEFCKTEVQRPDGIKNSEALNQLFIFFFQRQKPLGVLCPADIGARFDSARMTCSNAGKRAGTVQQTILTGFSASRDIPETLKYKAVVLLV